jgi:hypothetical protein
VDEVVPPPDTAERVADGVDMVMARLMNVLDSWITFEDNVMQELDAAEHATHNVMQGIVGEVELIENTSTSVTSSILDRVHIYPLYLTYQVSLHTIYTVFLTERKLLNLAGVTRKAT